MSDPSESAAALAAFFTWWRRVAVPGGFSSSARSMLDALDRLGPQRISDLASHERLSQPGTTQLVTRLADDGLVERFDDPDDGRVTRVRLTEVGAARIAELRAQRVEQLTALIGELAGADQAALQAAVPALARLTELPADLVAATRVPSGVSA